MAGLADMYQDYIDGKREIRDIIMGFRAKYESGIEGPERTECGYYKEHRAILAQLNAVDACVIEKILHKNGLYDNRRTLRNKR